MDRSEGIVTLHPLDQAIATEFGLVPQWWIPRAYKRYSAGVCRLYARTGRKWVLVAKRTGGGTWRGFR
jgi:hypothetical protein